MKDVISSIRNTRRRTLAIILILVTVLSPIALLDILTHLPPMNLAAVYARPRQKDSGAYAPPPLPTINWPVTFTDANYGRKRDSTNTENTPANGDLNDYGGNLARYNLSLKKAEAGTRTSTDDREYPRGEYDPVLPPFAEVGKKFIASGNGQVVFSFNGEICGSVTTNMLCTARVTFAVVVRDETANTELYYGLIEKLEKSVCTPSCSSEVKRVFHHSSNVISLVQGHTYFAGVWVKAEIDGSASYVPWATAFTQPGGTSRGITYGNIELAPNAYTTTKTTSTSKTTSTTSTAFALTSVMTSSNPTVVERFEQGRTTRTVVMTATGQAPHTITRTSTYTSTWTILETKLSTSTKTSQSTATQLTLTASWTTLTTSTVRGDVTELYSVEIGRAHV